MVPKPNGNEVIEMNRLILFIALTPLLSLTAHAQDTPKVEVFGGFSYANINALEERFSAKGWHAALIVNSKNWLDFVLDVSGHYGVLNADPTATYVVMVGPRIAFQHGRFTTFVHSLYGISFGHPSTLPPVEFVEPPRVWFTFVPAGGGLDIALGRRLALRVFQCDLIFPSRTPQYLQAPPELIHTTIQFRVSAGIVLRFGKV